MKKLLLSLVPLILLAGNARAGFLLSTSNPSGSPLSMSAGTTSGTMYVTVSGSSSSDIMSAWQFQLEIVAESGATGTLTFQDPATGTPANPSSYVFGGNGLGIVATTGGSQLSANDFFDPSVGAGTTVPSAGANLLAMDFSASSGASGLFGIYADEGQANTVWTDSSMTTQLFTNVPDGTGKVLIGEVNVTSGVMQAVPQPSSLTLCVVGGVTLGSWHCWRKRRQLATSARSFLFNNV